MVGAIWVMSFPPLVEYGLVSGSRRRTSDAGRDLEEHLQRAALPEERERRRGIVERHVVGEQRLGVEAAADDHVDRRLEVAVRVDARADHGELLEGRRLQVDGGRCSVDADDDDTAARLQRLRPANGDGRMARGVEEDVAARRRQALGDVEAERAGGLATARRRLGEGSYLQRAARTDRSSIATPRRSDSISAIV
jgi:hypothetical protein